MILIYFSLTFYHTKKIQILKEFKIFYKSLNQIICVLHSCCHAFILFLLVYCFSSVMRAESVRFRRNSI
jgi:Mn2+/Fe2+ NRAMP family transporter